MTPDPVSFATTSLIPEMAAAVNVLATARSVPNWLPATSIYLTTPPDPYPQSSPKPFAVLRLPQHSTADRESQTTGSTDGSPNKYTLYYYELAYTAGATRATEELRVIDTYAALASYFKQPDSSLSCLPNSNAYMLSVTLRENPAGPFVVFGGDTWIGAPIDFLIDEEYQ